MNMKLQSKPIPSKDAGRKVSTAYGNVRGNMKGGIKGGSIPNTPAGKNTPAKGMRMAPKQK